MKFTDFLQKKGISIDSFESKGEAEKASLHAEFNAEVNKQIADELTKQLPHLFLN